MIAFPRVLLAQAYLYLKEGRVREAKEIYDDC